MIKKIKSIVEEYRLVVCMILSICILYAVILKATKLDVYKLKEQVLVVHNDIRSGSAIMLNSKIAITANHLLDNNARVTFGERTLKYKILKRDKIRNVALIEIEAEDYKFKVLKLSKTRIRQDVDIIVIGNSYNRNRFVSRGKINSVILASTIYGYIDAVTTKEGEGSAVFDKRGRLIGIITHHLNNVSLIISLKELQSLYGEYKVLLK